MYKGHTSETDFKTDLNNPIFKFTEGSRFILDCLNKNNYQV